MSKQPKPEATETRLRVAASAGANNGQLLVTAANAIFALMLEKKKLTDLIEFTAIPTLAVFAESNVGAQRAMDKLAHRDPSVS